MDSRLLGYYERELKYLREMGGEFARDFPKIAGRLSLDEFACADPYVERLLEGFAFLSARVQLKLDAEFPRFVQSLLQTIYPQYLAPTPSMCVVQLQPELNEPSLADGFKVARGTSVKSLLGRGERTACEYRTAHEVTLHPIQVEEANYYTRELSLLELSPATAGLPKGITAAIRLRLRCTLPATPFSAINMDRLRFFLRGTPDTQVRLYEEIFAHAKAIVVQSATRPVTWRHIVKVAPGAGVARVGFDDDEALLPYTHRCFHGYRLLHEYFTFPQRFMSFELNGLAPGIKQCKEPVVDVVILLDHTELNLENAIDPTYFAPFCTPAINLFPKRCDRIHVSDRFAEFHVVPDRNRPLDFEVYEVTGVTGYGESSGQQRQFMPFYSAREFDQDGAAYYTMNRVPRTSSENEQRNGRRSKYAGSEVYLSLVDAKSAPIDTDLRQLGIESLCTNRDLPLFLPVGRGDTDFTLDAGGPIKAARCVSGPPTSPRASHAEGQVAWRLISHLSLNYLSLVDSDRGQGAAGLREMLSLYGDLADAHVRRQIDGIKSVASAPAIRRMPTPGPVFFARGIQETITFDEAAFEGTGAFLLGAVLEQFFSKYVAINSFTETVVRTMERGEIMRWPARVGQRFLL
jgi:type VI secretion system protein ImpG